MALARWSAWIGAAILLGACGLFDSGTRWRSGRFEVGWTDTASNSTLVYRLDASGTIGIVDACVFAAGANERYLVVKQRPSAFPAMVAYFILSKEQYDPLQSPERALVGPLSEEAYRAVSSALALPQVEPVIPEAVCNS